MPDLKRITALAGAALAVGFGYGRVARWLERPRELVQRGRTALTPLDMTWLGWRDILARSTTRVIEDRLTALAGAVAFFTLLSIVPALSVFISVFGFFTDPLTIALQLDGVTTLFPGEARQLIREQAARIAGQDKATLSATFLVSFLVAGWSANAAVKAVFDALNVVYGEREKRSFVRLNAISLTTTITGVFILAGALIVIAVVPVITALFPFAHELERLATLLRWPVFVSTAIVAIACLYWVGPSRHPPKFRWVVPGAILSALLWAATSALFSWYVSSLGNYTATYGSLATVVVFMTWLWLSATIVLAGAALNAELEHQTARDTTRGLPKPIGARGARMADSIGPAVVRRDRT